MNIAPSKTAFNRGEDYKFMNSRRNQNAARKLLEQIGRERIWSKEGFMNEAKRRGFMKTPQDIMIVKDVLKKMKFGNRGEFKERKRWTPEQLKEMGTVPDTSPEEKQMDMYRQL